MTRSQLLSLGLSSSAIHRRVRSRRLFIDHDGVYAVGYRTPDGWDRWAAALLAIGEDGALSHLAAAAAHSFGADPVIVDITCARRLQSRRGIRLHHHALDPRDVVRVNTLPLTSPAQTLFDLGTMLSAKAHAKSANEAFVLRIVTLDDLYETAARNANRKGSPAFRRLLATLDPEGREIRSPLTAPLTFDSDRRRDRRCRVEGWEPVRVTSRHLGPGADELDADLRSLLGLPPPA